MKLIEKWIQPYKPEEVKKALNLTTDRALKDWVDGFWWEAKDQVHGRFFSDGWSTVEEMERVDRERGLLGIKLMRQELNRIMGQSA